MLATGAKAPNVSLTGLSGSRETLAELIAKEPVLLAFYKVSCPVCQLTLPFLDRLAPGKLPVVTISQDDTSSTERFRQRFNLSRPVLFDREQDGYPASNAFGITNVPSLFLVEADGSISMAGSGFRKSDLEALGKRAGVTIFRDDENVPEWKAG
jgi:peroxiredoxin